MRKKRYPRKNKIPKKKYSKDKSKYLWVCFLVLSAFWIYNIATSPVSASETVVTPTYTMGVTIESNSNLVPDALEEYMKDQYLDELIPFYTTKTKGADAKETAQKIVEWQDKAIYYSSIKASVGDSYIQSPYETIMNKKGVCTDYAILASALLIKHGYTPYVFVTTTEGHRYDHAFAAVKQGNTFYAIDQVPPSRTVDGNLDYLKECYPDMVITNVRYYEVIKNGDDIQVNQYGYSY